MRCIGGLLLKDWYVARRRCWPLLPIAAVFAACTVYADSAWFAAYPLLLGAMLPVTLQAYDDACGFPRYAAALPVSRRALVGARYVTALLAPLPGAALLLLAGLIGAALGRPLPLSAGAIAALSLLPLLFSALALPLAFRFGTERARLLTVVLLGALCVLVMLPGGHGIALSLPGGAAGYGPLAALAAAVLALLALSYLAALKLYAPRAGGRAAQARGAGRTRIQ